MIVSKRIEGRGEFLANGKEFPASYHIIVSQNANRTLADGTTNGIDLPDIMDIQTAGDVKLRMEDGSVVDVVFLGGNFVGPQKFAINTRLPGY